MTALCGGGTSGPKPGFPSVVDYSVSLIAEILAARGMKWIIPILPLINVNAISVATFCASDPPALPTVTTAEAEAVLGLQFGTDFDNGIAKFRDIILRTIWYDLCDCTSGSLTTYAPPTIPTDTPIYQPPVPAPVTPCSTAAITPFTRSSGGPTFSGFVTNGSDLGKDFSIGVVTITVAASTGTFNVTTEIRQQTADASLTGHTFTFTSGVGTITRTIAFDPVYPIWAVYLTGLAGTGNRIVSVSAVYYCGGQVPGGTITPCCPPDEATQASLDLILRMVTLIQRQNAPFAYVYGANHTGLTGDGELAVNGLLGVSVDVTTTPTRIGLRPGTPESIWDVGEVTLGTDDGWTTTRRIDHDGSLILPPMGGVYTRVGYTLTPGVTVAIRELVREP